MTTRDEKYSHQDVATGRWSPLFRSEHADIFGGVRIIPVPPGHEHAPQPGTVLMSEPPGVCYVLEAEWPRLRARLMREI